MCLSENYLRRHTKKFLANSILLFCLFGSIVFLFGCNSLKAGRYLNDARDYSQNIRYRRKALQYYQKAWDLYFETAGESRLKAEMLYEMGNLSHTLQQYEHALRYYNRSLESLQFVEEELQLKILNNIGVIYRYLNIYEEALDSFEQARKILEQAKNVPEQESFLIHLNRAITLVKLGNRQQALEILEGLLTSENKKKYAYETALTQTIMGILEAEYFKDIQKALEYYEQALTIFVELDKQYDVAMSYHNIGLFHAMQRKYQEAIQSYEQARDLSQDIGDQETTWLAYYNLGNIYKEQSDFDKALGNYKQSIDIIESIRSKLKIDDFKNSFIEDKVDVYKAIINLLLDKEKKEEAFNYLERAKSRALVDLLSNQRIQTREGIDERLIKKKERADDNIRILSGKLDEENSKPEKKRKEVVHLTENLRQARQDYQRLLHEIQLNNPEYASLVSVNPPKLREIQNWIPDHTAFLEYLVLEDKILIFILTRDELHVVEDKEITQKELQGTVLAFRIDIEREMSDWREKSQWLYSKLIAPMEKHLDNIDTLCIIPYGILHYLPFGALLNKSNNQFLLEQPYDLFYAPSATMLKFAFNKRDKRPLALPNQNNTHNLLLIFANPDGNLDFAEDEAKEIQKLYPQKTLLLKESDATEGKVKDLVENYCLIHFATHGILDPVQPLFSSLVFADGFLEVHEIFNEIALNNSSLVTLSACNTALGRRTEGDEIIGLTRAFIYAGAPSIMASLWAVDDQSTALIMQRFYEYLKENKYNNKAKALKEAQKSLLKHPKFHHPYYWAAFELFGDYT